MLIHGSKAMTKTDNRKTKEVPKQTVRKNEAQGRKPKPKTVECALKSAKKPVPVEACQI